MKRIETVVVNVEEVRRSILSAGVLENGHYIFADGGHGLVKIEMDNLWKNQTALELVLSALAEARGLPEADVIIGVPTGGYKLARAISENGLNNVPLARVERILGGDKRDFQFSSELDREMALSARSVRIYEDVVTTLGSVAAVVKMFQPDIQTIHSLAIWRRGKIKDEYRAGVIDHYLIEEELPSFCRLNAQSVKIRPSCLARKLCRRGC